MCSFNTVMISNGSFSVNGLGEFTSYSCRIAGFSAPFVATTLSDSKYMCCYSLQGDCCCFRNFFPPLLFPSPSEPSSPPEGVELVPDNSTSLRLQWGLPPESERNGIITQYVVECTGIASVQSPVVPTSPTFSTPPSLQQLLTGLDPFTSYSCRVAATNVNGTGPFSAWVSATTLEGCELGQHTWGSRCTAVIRVLPQQTLACHAYVRTHAVRCYPRINHSVNLTA